MHCSYIWLGILLPACLATWSSIWVLTRSVVVRLRSTNSATQRSMFAPFCPSLGWSLVARYTSFMFLPGVTWYDWDLPLFPFDYFFKCYISDLTFPGSRQLCRDAADDWHCVPHEAFLRRQAAPRHGRDQRYYLTLSTCFIFEQGERFSRFIGHIQNELGLAHFLIYASFPWFYLSRIYLLLHQL